MSQLPSFETRIARQPVAGAIKTERGDDWGPANGGEFEFGPFGPARSGGPLVLPQSVRGAQ
jgi:hypothetical protein